MFIVEYTDFSGNIIKEEYEYLSSAKILLDCLKENYPTSNPVIIEK